MQLFYVKIWNVGFSLKESKIYLKLTFVFSLGIGSEHKYPIMIMFRSILKYATCSEVLSTLDR